MTVSVLTAIDHRREAAIVARLGACADLSVVRRCADLADLIAAASAGIADVAVVSGGLRGLDRDALDHLHAGAVAVVGLVEDEDEDRRLRQLGVAHLVSADQAPERLADVLRSLAAPPAPRAADRVATVADELAALEAGLDPDELGYWAPSAPLDDAGSEEIPLGRVIAVWGPAGAPGRTTIAVNVAAELAATGAAVLLIDADTYAASIAQLLGVLDESPGMAAAARAAELGTLDLPTLARLAPTASRQLRVLTGMPVASRWTELRAESMSHLIGLARQLCRYVVIDCASCLEDDEELSYDTRAPRRNAATLTSLAEADELIAVGGADPVGLQRLVRGLQDLLGVAAPSPTIVVNHVRPGAIGASPERRISEALERFAGVTAAHFIPEDRAALDRCLLSGRVLREEVAGSVARERIRQLAMALVPDADPHPPASRRHGRRRSVTIGRWSTD